MVLTKICNKCKQEKDISQFTKDSKSKDGIYYLCKVCKNNKRDNVQAREYSKTHYPENKEKAKEIHKIFMENHPNYYNDYTKKYEKLHPEKVIAKRLKRTLNGMNSIDWQKRVARKNLVISNYNIELWEQCKTYFNNKCAYCGSETKLTQDHFIPLTKKGEYSINNIIPVCVSCNCSKRNKDFFEWYPTRTFYNKQREAEILKYLNYDIKTKNQQLALII